jgi:hypothetical protein
MRKQAAIPTVSSSGEIFAVMPGLVPGIHDRPSAGPKDVDGRNKPGHDGGLLEYLLARKN